MSFIGVVFIKSISFISLVIFLRMEYTHSSSKSRYNAYEKEYYNFTFW